MLKNIVIIIEARMGSTRFPGKTLAKLGKYCVLEYLIHRVSKSRLATDIYLATTDSAKDDSIIELANKIGLKYYRGSEENVLNRFYETAKLAKADIIVEVTGDCPMIDAALIDEGIKIYLDSDYDCVGIGMNNSYPHGLDYYIINMRLLEEMDKNANTPFQREHVIEYVTSQPEKFKCFYLTAPKELNRPDVRITVDYSDDLEVMHRILKIVGDDKFNYSAKDIIAAWDMINDKKSKI